MVGDLILPFALVCSSPTHILPYSLPGKYSSHLTSLKKRCPSWSRWLWASQYLWLSVLAWGKTCRCPHSSWNSSPIRRCTSPGLYYRCHPISEKCSGYPLSWGRCKPGTLPCRDLHRSGNCSASCNATEAGKRGRSYYRNLLMHLEGWW